MAVTGEVFVVFHRGEGSIVSGTYKSYKDYRKEFCGINGGSGKANVKNQQLWRFMQAIFGEFGDGLLLALPHKKNYQ